MATHTNEIVPAFNFSVALQYSHEERMRLCVERVRHRLITQGEWDIFGVPPVPASGSRPLELKRLEADLGVPLPTEYRAFLRQWRYLVMDDGLRLWGLDHDGVRIGTPWLSEDHRPGVKYLVFGDYWGYADGDQLMFEIGDPQEAVVAYLHEHGPLYEAFAPSFSLALWRMVEEWS
jgi:hypothetical protein